MVSNLLVFYAGGLSYTEAQNMPFPELYNLQEQAKRISAERKRASGTR